MEYIAKNNHRLDLSFVALICINFIIIVFLCGVMAITLEGIIELHNARAFLDQINALPFPPYISLIQSLGSFLLILVLFYITFKYKQNDLMLWMLFVLEILLSINIIYHMGFSNNSILLLIIAHLFYTINKNKFFPFLLIISIILYTLLNYDILTDINAIPFYQFIECYDKNTQMMLNGIEVICVTLNIVIFIVFIYFVIQNKVNESKEVEQLNNELLVLNNHLQEYASIQQEMGKTAERNRLAREIHDTLGHTLTGLSVGLDAAIMILDVDNDAVKKQLGTLSETARQGLKDVRRSVEKLRPDALENYSLQEALVRLITDFQMVSKVKIQFICELESLIFSKDEEEIMYRIVQEGLTNAVRHGKANQVFISFALENETLILIVEDDGIGCSKIEYGFGLHHMEERLNILKGSFRVYGTNGFIIIAEIPIRKEV